MVCTSENYEMDLVIDVNTQLYPIGVGQRFTFALARTLNEDGSADDDVYDQVRFVFFDSVSMPAARLLRLLAHC